MPEVLGGAAGALTPAGAEPRPGTSAAASSLFLVESDDGEAPPRIVVPSRRTRAKSA